MIAALRALVVGALVLAPGVVQAQWSANEWRVRCAASSDQVVMEIAQDLTGRSFECRYFLPDDAGDREMLVVPEMTRRAIEEALTEVSEWYDGHGFREPLIHDIHQPIPSSTPSGAKEAGLAEPIRLGPIEEGTQFAPFLALIDPLPILDSAVHEHGHGDRVLGYYYSVERLMVVSLDALKGPDGAFLSLVPAIDRDTIAHEMFHAILAAREPGGRPQFIEEGLAEMFGKLYIAQTYPHLARHPLSARLTTHRFSEWPLNSDGDEAYDSAIFWRHVHDRVVDGIPAFLRLVSDFDLDLDEEGSGTADAWLLKEVGRPLMLVWRDFAQRISEEAEAAGLLDQLVKCRDIEMTPDDPMDDAVYRKVLPAGTASTYLLSCLRVVLPRADAEREFLIEDAEGAAHPYLVEIFAEGSNMRDRRLTVPAGQTKLTLILAPHDTDHGHAPVQIEIPELHLVLEAPRTGCDPSFIVRPEDLTGRDRARMQALAGPWRMVHHSMTAMSPLPERSVYSDNIDKPRTYDMALRYEAGTLTTDWQTYDFFLVPDAGTLSDVPGLETECGTTMTVNGRSQLSTDWLRAAPGAATVFLVERREAIPGRNRCDGVAIFTDHRMVTFNGFTMPPPIDDVWWESLAFERPRRR